MILVPITHDQEDHVVKCSLAKVSKYTPIVSHPEDIKRYEKVRKKARWLLKNWYMTSKEWEDFKDG